MFSDEDRRYVVLGGAIILFLLIFLEASITRRRNATSYSWRESLATLGIFVGHKVAEFSFLGVALLVGDWIWDHRIFTFSANSPWSIAVVFLGVEFAYYWHHRFSHEVNWMWATHSVHHTPENFNLSVSLRLGWTILIDGFVVFMLPLVWLGFPLVTVLTVFTASKVYQFWIHTALVGKLGWFDRIFNSPANHRVHHASNQLYLDKNYGSILVVFDRLFGTYMPLMDEEPCRFGLVHPLQTHNPFRIALSGWISILNGLSRQTSLSKGCLLAFGRPGRLET